MTKTIPQKRKARRGNCCLRRLYSSIAKERREAKSRGERERYNQLNAQFLAIARRDNVFFNEQCKEVEENNRMGKTRDHFKKTGDTKVIVHVKRGTINNRNGKDLTETEEIKKK